MIKRIVILFIIWLGLEINHSAWNDSNLAFDIFLLYDHEEPGRYITNIFYDLSAHWAWCFLTYSLYMVLNYLKNIYTSNWELYSLSRFAPYMKAIFVWRVFEFILYFAFCNQSTNLISIPFLFLLLIFTHAKARKSR
jgi:FlaA1/EpsC-like NDP-sugar epimerase